MKHSLNKGFILIESVVAFAMLTTCIFIFLSLQSGSLQQTAHLQEKAEILRVLFEEVENQQSSLPADFSYSTDREERYQLKFWQRNQHQQVQINKGDVQVVIQSED